MVGRERELAVADQFLDGLADGPAALILSGDAGIGKTTVWREGLARAERRGVRVLKCGSVEAEARLTYSGLADLLVGLDDETLLSLPEPQGRALAVALVRADPQGEVVEQRAVAAGVSSLLQGLAVERPLLVAVDDVQWLDTSTARALSFAARRLGAARVGFLLSLRGGSALSDPLGVVRCLEEDRLWRLALGGLRLGALRQLLGGGQAPPVPPREVLRARPRECSSQTYRITSRPDRGARKQSAHLDHRRGLNATARTLRELVAVVDENSCSSGRVQDRPPDPLGCSGSSGVVGSRDGGGCCVSVSRARRCR